MKELRALLIVLIFISCQHNPTIDIDVDKVKIELDSIFVLDQKYRQELSTLHSQYGFESIEFQSVLKKQHAIDSTNLIYVENLINEYGKYPGRTLVGQSTSEVAFFVLQHQADSIQAKHIDLILDAAKNNELNKRPAALFYDRYLINQGEPQIYGSQISIKEVIDSLTGKSKKVTSLFPIKDTTNIDSLRMWNGLGPLEDQLNSYGLSRWTNEPVGTSN